MAPSTIGRERTKRRPSRTVCQLTGSSLGGSRGRRTADIRTTAIASNATTQAYTTDGPARYRTPPRVGPAIVASWNVDELSAIALPRLPIGTRFGVMACEAGMLNARATPNSTITANTGQTTVSPLSVKPSSSRPHSTSMAKHR